MCCAALIVFVLATYFPLPFLYFNHISVVIVTMSSSQHLKEFIRERLTVAAEEIFSEFEKSIIRCEEKIRLLDVYWKPQVKLQRIDLPRQHVCMEEEVSAEKLVCDKETICSRDLEESQPLRIKQEEEELCSSQEEEPELKEETNRYMLNPRCEEDVPQKHVCTEEETHADQLLCDQESNSDQEEPEPLRIKEEQDDFWSSREELEAQEEPNGSMTAPSSEEGGSNESEQYSGFLKTSITDQIQPHNFFVPQDVFYEGREAAAADYLKTAELKPDMKHYYDNMNFPLMSEADSKVDATKRSFQCGYCEKTFQFKSKLVRHLATHMVKSKFTCGVCRKSFSQNSQLSHHMRLHACGGKMLGQHGGLLTHAVEKRFVCNTCGKRFSKGYILNRHTKLHTGERPFTCSTCGKSFSRRDHMLGHMKTHLVKGASVCSSIKKARIPSPPSGKQTPIHTAKKLFSCEKCGKNFGRHRSFLCHMKTHRDVTSLVCKICGKHFNQLSGLKRHESIHTGLKPFSCGMCGKSVSRRDHLLRHMRLHTDLSS